MKTILLTGFEAFAGLPGFAVVGVAGEDGEEGGEFAEDHLFVDDVDLALAATFERMIAPIRRVAAP